MIRVGTHKTFKNGYTRSADDEIATRENWEGMPTIKNFTGCGGGGWNQNINACKKCYEKGKGSRWCNLCKPDNSMTKNAGMQPANFVKL